MNMATDTAERRIAHMRGVTVTAIACLAGVVAALVSSVVATGAGDTLGVYVLAAAILVQFPLLRVLEMAGLELDIEDFGAKDYLYVAFMTFALWFVCWAILLTTGASL
ncbi:MAG: protein involved in ribonucleotide reduction [Natronomonas sp.]|jgi:protein involved in ribonucleotide reduction